ncbi:MAG: transglycosylase SLT domain-containing protein [bacterium]|nr:transglycosylase SLT domain-containing protein [bacterium]
MDQLLKSPVQDLLGGARGAAEGRRLEALASGLENGRRDAEGLRLAAKEFEAVFLNQLLKSMRATVPENDLFNAGGATKFYRQMHDAELAQALANTGSGLGIADLVVQQLSPPVDAEPDAEIIGPPTPPPDLPGAAAAYRRLGGQVFRPLSTLENAPGLKPAEADTLRRHGTDMSDAARRHGLAPELVLAVVMEESGGEADAVSPKGAQGLMQLMPATAREMGVDRSDDPGQNLAGGSRYLAEMLERYDDDLELALAAYNAGPGNVDRAGGDIPPFPETQRYVARVLDRYRRLTAGTDLANRER